ncbi:MAG: KdsC family phosphatase, partial [Candidatus Binatia bacterium]
MELAERAKRIKLLLMDCDGVLTDGRLYFSAAGEELKVFHVRDGEGIAAWHKAGYASGIISGRASGGIIQVRAQELDIKYVRAGSRDKVKDLEEIISDERVSPDDVAYVGDDVGD